MNSTYAAKVLKWMDASVNKGWDFDGYYGFQCYDLAQFYNRDVVGNPARFYGLYAADIITQAGTKYRRIDNTPEFVPQLGDLMVWNKKMGGGAGHVAICTGEGDTTFFMSLDQNWVRGEATYIRHTYDNVIGVLRPLESEQVTVKPSADNEGIVQGDSLRGHTAPTLSSPVPWYFDDQEKITLIAKTHGDSVAGTWGTTDWWYLATGVGSPQVWVSDGYVLTTKNPANVPDYKEPTKPVYSPRPTGGLFGVDVSSFQGDIDWPTLKGQVDFAIIRAGHVGESLGGGVNKTDVKLQQNRDGARAVGLPCGFYWYGYPALDAKAEAANFVNSVGPLQDGECLFLDLEEQDPNARTWAVDFMNEVEKLSGRMCHLYTYSNYAKTNDLAGVLAGSRELWLANFNNTPGAGLDNPLKIPVLHQYTSSGKVKGVTGNVDLNVFFDPDFATLAAKLPAFEPAPAPGVEERLNALESIIKLITAFLDRIFNSWRN